MIINTNITLGYKCSHCGRVEFFTVSLFKSPLEKTAHLTCRCRRSGITITSKSPKEYILSIPCIGCGGEHIFSVTRHELLHTPLIIFSCPYTMVNQCILGRDEDVCVKIDAIEKQLDDIINMFGYDNYFTNTQVMFDSINIIHDIAESGNLYCECGNDDIDVILLKDKILLKCTQCPATKVIQATSNSDLKKISSKKQLLITEV